MMIPAHIDPADRSPAACRQRAEHYQRMMQLRPDGNGFRRVPEHSDQMSIVERALVEAGDMEPPPRCPPDRRYRQARRPRY